jgi:hypothetical protein
LHPFLRYEPNLHGYAFANASKSSEVKSRRIVHNGAVGAERRFAVKYRLLFRKRAEVDALRAVVFGPRINAEGAAALPPASCISALGATIANAKSLLQVIARGEAEL